MMSTSFLATSAAEAEEATRELPLPPYAFGLIALGVFVALFVLLWSFRSIASKH